MIRLFTALLLLATFLARAQNLVPNPSFEETLQPLCSFIAPGENISEYISAWRAPTGGTTDYWTSAPTFPGCSRNLRNATILPRTGSTCIGMYVSAINLTNLGNRASVRPYREYAQVRLRQPLVKGRVYYAEMYISLFERSALAANNIGMLFTKTAVERRESIGSFGSVLAYQPQVNNPNPYANTGRWYKVSGCFIADEAYEYLTIGNFFDEANTTFLATGRTGGIDPYYLVDDVYVGEPENALPPISLGRDTVLCGSQTLTYQLPVVAGVTYRWQDGTNGPSYTIRQSGQYILRAQTATVQCELIDTVQVMAEPSIQLAPDTVFCSDEPITIRPLSPDGGNIEWSDGSRGPTLTISQSGTYWVRRLSERCPSADTLVARAVGCPGPVPNVFSPNNDGVNDTFRIPNLSDVPWRLTIVNRWGKLVYEAEPYANDWTGDDLPSGVYYYRLSTTVFNRSFKGTVTIFRE